MNLRMQDMGTGIPAQELCGLQRGDSEFREEVCKVLTEFSNELVRREAAFDQVKRTVGELQQQSRHLFQNKTMRRLFQQLDKALRQD